MADSLLADPMTDSTERNAAGHSAEPADSADLATAVIRLVPVINDAVTAHRAGSCRWCTPTTRGGCPRHAW